MWYNNVMSVQIKPYSSKLVDRFEAEKARIRGILGNNVTIEHVGSSAVGIGGKNIVDILIGVKDTDEMQRVRDELEENGYFEGNDSHPDRIFMATSEAETKEGDYHVHISPRETDTYQDFIILRDYLRNNPEEAERYYREKETLAKETKYDRKKYRALKSEYVSKLIKKAKTR